LDLEKEANAALGLLTIERPVILRAFEYVVNGSEPGPSIRSAALANTRDSLWVGHRFGMMAMIS
jgi:hypothetical protein